MDDSSRRIEYPKRPVYWANKVQRALIESEAVSVIGRDACWLVTFVAAREDMLRYSKVPRWWTPQLMDSTGFTNKRTFLSARKAAVDAGWLIVNSGGKGVEGEYFTRIPGAKSHQQSEESESSRCEIAPHTAPTNAPHPIPSIPVTQESESAPKQKGKADSRLIEFCPEWNAWHSAGIIRQMIRDTNSPGKGIEDAWKRSQRDKEQRERLNDLPALQKAIEGSQQFLRDAGWFNAAGLIGGKNSNRLWYAEQLVAGAYLDKSGNGNAGRPSPEASKAWQKTLEEIRQHSSWKSDEIRQAIGERAWRALKSIGGAKQVERWIGSDCFELRSLEKRFHQEFSKG